MSRDVPCAGSVCHVPACLWTLHVLSLDVSAGAVLAAAAALCNTTFGADLGVGGSDTCDVVGISARVSPRPAKSVSHILVQIVGHRAKEVAPVYETSVGLENSRHSSLEDHAISSRLVERSFALTANGANLVVSTRLTSKDL